MTFDDLLNYLKQINNAKDLYEAKSIAYDVLQMLNMQKYDNLKVYLHKNSKNRIETIKIIRTYSGLGLSEAKGISDKVLAGHTNVFVGLLPEKNAKNFVIDITKDGGKASAVPDTNLARHLYD